jgi:hypothetical protein
MYEQLPQSRKDAVTRSVYSGRRLQAEEVAQAIFWLGTSSPDYLSGTTVDVNNGFVPPLPRRVWSHRMRQPGRHLPLGSNGC